MSIGRSARFALPHYLAIESWSSSPYINRFLQPDTVISNPANPQSWNHFSYVLNSPIMYSDPTGHCSVSGHWLSDDTDACKWNNVESSIDKPGDKCTGHCYNAYLTYKTVAHQLGHKPTSAELLSMTASAEYYSLIRRPDAGNLRSYGQEALARNYYEACGGEDVLCTDEQTYQFLSGYEPWWRQTGGATPASRANDIMSKQNSNPYRADLADDVAGILNYTYASDPRRDWTGGQYWNRPWQWRNVTYKPSQTGDLNSNTGAIMYIDLGGGKGYFGQYFWIVTARQDWCYKYPDDPQYCK